MTTKPGVPDELVSVVADLKLKDAIELARKRIAEGIDALSILDLCNQGMVLVGRRYEEGEIFISGLVMAGEIMRRVGQYVLPLMKPETNVEESGRILLGTARGDIHYIGKDIFKILARSHGFSVHDLGVDVPPNKFIDAVYDFNPDIVGISCLISTCYDAMRDTIAQLRKEVPKDKAPRVYVIGGLVDQQLYKYVQADYWANDAMNGVRICQKVMKEAMMSCQRP